MTNAVGRRGQFIAGFLLVAGIGVLQVMMARRGLLFSIPGYILIGLGALVGVLGAVRSRVQPDLVCLGATAVFLGYILFRALASAAYFARPDLYSVIAALVVYGLVATVLTSSTVRVAIFAALVIIGMAHVAIGVMQFTRGDNFMLIPYLQRADYGQRASGFYGCPNHLAGLLEVLGVFGVSLTCWGRWPVWTKLLLAYATGTCYLGLALTGSRGGYLSVATSLIVFAVLSLIVLRSGGNKILQKFAVSAVVGLTVAFIAAALLVRQSAFLSERAGNIVDSKNTRLTLWRAAIEQWKLEPILGTGSGTYRFYGRQFRAPRVQEDPVDVHNDYLHLLCEYGMLGAGGFLLFFAAHMRHGWRSLRLMAARSPPAFGAMSSNRLALTLGALAAIAAYVVHSVFDFNLHMPANAALVALVFGIIANPSIPDDSGARPKTAVLLPRIATGLLALLLIIQCGRLSLGEYYAECARTALRGEDPASSLTLAKKALEHEHQNPEIYFSLGRANLALCRRTTDAAARADYYRQAIAAFQEARRLAPLDGSYPLNLAFIYDEIGQFAEAETMYGLARSRDPHSRAVSQLYEIHLKSWKKNGPAAPVAQPPPQ